MMKRIKNITGADIKMVMSVTLMVMNTVICLFLCTIQMYSNAAIFFFFAVGAYWYFRLLHTEQRQGVWYELEDDIK